MNEANFVHRVREVTPQDNPLQGKRRRRRLQYKEGLWWKDTGEATHAMYIPQIAANALRMECISWVHARPFTGHVGMHRTSEILRRWWPTMELDIIQYVQNCEMCSRNKPTNRKQAGLLSPLPIPGRPWESIGMDFITHLPKTQAGHKALYVVVDRLTKLVHIAPTTDNATAEEKAQLFLDLIFKHHGLPRNIVGRRVRGRGVAQPGLCSSTLV